MSTWIEASLHDAVMALMRHGENDVAAALFRMLDEPDVKTLQFYRSPQVAALADEIFDCDGLDTLYDLLRRVTATFGVAHCTVHGVRERKSARYSSKVLTTYPSAWVQEYVDRRYSTVDPVIARCLQGPGVFYWDEVADPDANPIVGHFLRSARAHGVGPAGVTFVADNAHGDTFAVTLAASCEPEDFRSRFQGRMSDFEDIAPLIVEVFSELACEHKPSGGELTDDQLKVLRALACGKSQAEVETMHFTFGSFVTIEKSILMNLGARTLTQAAALAARLGLFENLPYFEEDIYSAQPAALWA